MRWGKLARRPRKPEGVDAYLMHLEKPERSTRGRIGGIEARTLREMIDAGFEVQTVWGPVQMDVWRLTLARGNVTVDTGIERGISDGLHLSVRGLEPLAGSAYLGRPYPFMHFVWAIRTASPQLESAAVRLIDWADRSLDAVVAALPEWRQVADWLENAAPDDVSAIARASETLSVWTDRLFFGAVQPGDPSSAALAEAARELEESARK